MATDPSTGTGKFIGLMPKAIRSKSEITAIELDTISAIIAKQLYQKQDIREGGFEKQIYVDNYYDLAITNVPFANVKPYDKRYKREYQLHNLFFKSAVDRVRPGGLVVFITAQGTLAGTRDARKLREELTKTCDLIAAYKLPQSTFSKANGEDLGVTADLIIMQKRERPRTSAEAEKAVRWLNVERLEISNYGNTDTAAINEYFVNNPDNILGDKSIGGLYNTLQVSYKGVYSREDKLGRLQKLLREAIQKLPENIYQKATGKGKSFDTKGNTYTYLAEANDRQGSYRVKDGIAYQVQKGKLVPVDKDKELVKDFVELKNSVKAIYKVQINPRAGESTLEYMRKELNSVYDSFVAKHGYIGNHLSRLGEDTEYGMVAAIEKYTPGKKGNKKKGIVAVPATATKTAIFTERTVSPISEVTHADTAEDALMASLNQNGTVDLEYMAELTKSSEDELIKSLEGIIYLDPELDSYVTADEYLSGEVRTKLAEAKEAVKKDKRFADNVKALEKVQPLDLTERDIKVRLGPTWIPVEDYSLFLNSLADLDYEVVHNAVTGKYFVKSEESEKYNAKATKTWGSGELTLGKLAENALNNSLVTVNKKDIDGKTYEDVGASEAANAKIDELHEKFAEWLWSDQDRKLRLLNKYNNTFNNNVPRNYDGSYIKFEGMNRAYTLNPHQYNAVARILHGNNTLLAHGTGAGKTFTMVASSMEMKRLGMIKKAMHVVPTNIVGQYEQEARSLYPQAKILTLTAKELPNTTFDIDYTEKISDRNISQNTKDKNKKDKETAQKRKERIAKRQKTLAGIATEDWDIIICSHEIFSNIPLHPERYKEFYREQLEDAEEAIREAKKKINEERFGYNKPKRVNLNRLEKTKVNLEARLTKDTAEDAKDIVIPFEELGIDQLFVDEADLFKNLAFHTSMTKVKGLNSNGSKRAMDLYTKSRYLNEVRQGRGLVLSTATPISNSLAETYTIQRYLIPHKLIEWRMRHFDAWASNFTKVIASMELSPDGSQFRKVSRLVFDNIPALYNSFISFADIKHSQDLGLKLPKLKGGSRITIKVKPTEALKQFKKFLVKRAEKIANGDVDPREDNALKLTGDFRRASIDLRMIDPGISAEEAGAKINALVEKVAEIYERTTDILGTQMVFADLGTPRAKKDNTDTDTGADTEEDSDNGDMEFSSVYETIREGLVKKGVPREQIVFAHEGKNKDERQAIFERVRNGEVRVLIGSTAKMGAGTNAQDNLIALHHLDCPWRPRDIEQREGRIIRQGNKNEEVEIYNYVTEGSYDANMWEMVLNKAQMIDALMRGDTSMGTIEDVGDMELNARDVVAEAVGNPYVKEKMSAESEIAKLIRLKADYNRKIQDLKRDMLKLPQEVKRLEEILTKLQKDQKARKDIKGDKFSIKLGDKVYKERVKADDVLRGIADNFSKSESTKIGEFAGFDVKMVFNRNFEEVIGGIRTTKGIVQVQLVNNQAYSAMPSIQSLSYAVGAGLDKRIADIESSLKQLKDNLQTVEKEVQKPFPKQQELDDANRRLAEANAKMDGFSQVEMAKPSQEEYSLNEALDEETNFSLREDSELINFALREGINLDEEIEVLDLDKLDNNLKGLSGEQIIKYIVELSNSTPVNTSDLVAMVGLPRDNYGRKHIVFNKSNRQVSNRNMRNTILSNFKDIINSSVVVEVMPNKKLGNLDSISTNKREVQERKNKVKDYYRLMLPVKQKGEIKTLVIVAEDSDGKLGLDKGNISFYENFFAKKKELTSPVNADRQKVAPFTITIREMLSGVKDADGIYYLKEDRSPVQEAEDTTRLLDDIKKAAKATLPNAKNIQDDGERISFTMPNDALVVVDIVDIIHVSSEILDKGKDKHGIPRDISVAIDGTERTIDGKALIKIATGAREGTIHHETFHAIWDLTLTDVEKEAIKRGYEKEANAKGVDIIELAADKFKEYMIVRIKSNATMFGKLWQKIKDMASYFREFITGVTRAKDVFRRSATGKVWERPINKSAGELEQELRLSKEAGERLEHDIRLWNGLCDLYEKSNKDRWRINNNGRLFKFMQKPLVLDLVGVKSDMRLSVYGSFFGHVLTPKHRGMDIDVLKQLPRAMTDPVMILKGTTDNKVVFVLEVKDNNGATVIVPVEIERKDPEYGTINVLNSAYGKTKNDNITSNSTWFINQILAGNLLYINKEKALTGAGPTGLELINSPNGNPALRSALSNPSIKTEKDLVKLGIGNPDRYSMHADDINFSMQADEKSNEKLDKKVEDIIKEDPGLLKKLSWVVADKWKRKVNDKITVKHKEDKEAGEVSVWTRWWQSPSRIAEKSELFREFFKMASRAMDKLVSLRNHYARKQKSVYKLITGKGEVTFKRNGKEYTVQRSEDDLKQFLQILTHKKLSNINCLT